MWKYFEGLINAFPDQVTASDSNAKPASTTPENTNQPPTNFFGFIRFYSRGIWKFLVAVSIISALIALGEALFFTTSVYSLTNSMSPPLAPIGKSVALPYFLF